MGVWVGNFNSRGAAGIVGALAAAPLMFDIFRAIDPGPWDGYYPWFERAKKQLTQEKVCAFSGYPPGENCSSTKTVLVLKNHHPYIKCPFHRRFLVERKTGFRACPFKNYRRGQLEFRVFTVFPPAVRQVLRQGFPPPFPPDCPLSSGVGVRILSPQNGAVYFIVRGVRGAEGLLFQATSGKGKIYWFCDGKYLGSSASGEAIRFPVAPGKHRILAQGQEGSSALVNIKVREFEGER